MMVPANDPMDRPESKLLIVLASQSPRRAQLLREAGIAFEVVPPGYEEPAPEDWTLDAVSYVESASYFKARSLADQFPDRIILGADTAVRVGDQLFGKPADREDARRILTTLGGTTHEVITGVTAYHPARQAGRIAHAVTRVRMRAMSNDELDTYLASGQWAGKAGAYGIQDRGDAFVTLVEGDFDNVVGLPVRLVREMLRAFG